MISKIVKRSADYLPRKQRYETYNRLFQERNSFSKTDTDATFMRMKDDYMRNGQLKPCYNLQIATENQYVLAYDLFPNPTDTKNLNPFLDSFLERHNGLVEYIVADAGYGSEENYTYINDILHKTPLIIYASYHKENKKTYRNSPFMIDNWCYLEEDTYICPAHQAVSFKRYSRRKDKGGFVRDFKIYEYENCRDCPVRSQYTKAKVGEVISNKASFNPSGTLIYSTAVTTVIAGSASLVKTDRDTGEVLPGAVFKVIAANGQTIVENLTTNEQGIVQTGVLSHGSYFFVETQAPQGYELDATPIPFTVTENQTEPVKISAVNKAMTGSVTLTKLDKERQVQYLNYKQKMVVYYQERYLSYKMKKEIHYKKD